VTGLIFGSIIAAWAAVLVPMWLRRHDERNEARSVERFSSAMRVLARRTGTAGKRRPPSVMMPGRTEVDDVHIAGASHRPARATGPSSPAARASSSGDRLHRGGRSNARARLARRRRRTLLSLVLLVLASTALGVVGITAALWVAAPAALLLAGFVVHLRVQARVAQQAARRRSAAARRSAAREMRLRETDRLRRVPPGVAEVGDGEVFDAADGANRVPGPDWEPRDVPLPTYVTKPTAPRVPATSTVGHAAPEPQDDTDEALDDELGPLLERRRVVGE
jgi:hypothetical protein